MNPIFSVLLFVAFFCPALQAQKNALDVVYLKNGSIIRGKLVSQGNDSIKIETCCRNLFVFSNSEVMRLTFEPSSGTIRMNSESNSQKGFYSYSTIGLLAGKSEVMDAPGISLNSFVGYGFTNSAAIALGLGYEVLHTDIIPLKLGFKYELTQRDNSPVIMFSAGYSFPLDEEKKEEYINYTYNGGLNAGIDIGICSYRSAHRAFTITIGYQYQRLTEKVSNEYWYNQTEINTYDFNKLAIRIGFLFN